MSAGDPTGQTMPPPEAGVAAQSFQRWLAAPPEDRGIHAWQAGTWQFHSYADIAAAADRLARALRQASGVGEPLSVSVLSEHAPTVLAGFGAAWLLGGAAHVLPQPLAFRQWEDYQHQVQHTLGLTRCRHIVFGQDSAETAERLDCGLGRSPTLVEVRFDPGRRPSAPVPVPGRGSEEVVVHQLTSGSTGPPQLIEVSAGNLVANLEGMRRWLGWRDRYDAWASWLPLHHDMGLVGGLFVPASRGSDLWAVPPREFLRDPGRWLDPLADDRATVTAAPTFGYAYTAKRVTKLPAGADLSGWRVACVGAEVVTEDVLADFTRRFEPYGFSPSTWCPAYGMAEATLCVTAVDPGAATRVACVADDAVLRPGEPVEVTVRTLDRRADGHRRRLVGCGGPLHDTSVDVVDDHGRPLPDGHFGEVVVRGPAVARVRPPGDATRMGTVEPGEARHDERSVLAHSTGDGGIKLDGELFVVGRLGDGIKLRGDFVDCEGLEQRLAHALEIAPERTALALGQVGTEVRAVLLIRASESAGLTSVSRAEGVTRAALGAGARLIIVPVPGGAVPKTSSGKVKRREIWRRWGESPDPATS